MDQQSFNNYLSNLQSNATSDVNATQQPVQQGQQQTPSPKPSGNWLTHLLPTGGAIGGGLGGAAAGATIGSAVPILGTAIGGIAGGILGAAFGGGGGKAAENAAEGKGIDNGVGTAAVEGGVGQALGGIAGKALGKGAELLANRAGGVTDAAKVADTATTDLANNKTLNAIYGTSKNDVGGAATMAQQAGLDMTNPQSINDAGSQILSNAGDALREQIGTAQIPISGVVTKEGTKVAPSIDDLVNSSLTNTHPLTGEQLGASRSAILGGLGPGQTDQDLLNNGYTRFLGSSSKAGSNTPATSYLKEANQILAPINHGSVTDAQDLLTTQRIVGDRAQMAAQAAAKPSATIQDQAAAATWKDLNGKLQDMIFSHPEVSDNIKNMVGNATPDAFGGNQALTDMFNNRVSAATSGKDLNGLMHDAYNLRDVGSDGLNTVNNPASAGSLKLANINNAGTEVPVTPSTAEVGHKIIAGGGGSLGVAGRAIVHGANNPAILNTLSRLGILTSKIAPTAGVVAATAPNLGAAPVGVPQQGGTMGATMQPAQQSPLNQLYQTLLDNYNASGGITPNDASIAGNLSSLVPQVQKNNMLSNELGALPASFANAGGAQGAGGILSRISGLIPGTAAHTFQQQQAGVAQALAAQLGISPQAAMGLLPQLMQNQQTAGQNQGVLSQLTGQLAY